MSLHITNALPRTGGRVIDSKLLSEAMKGGSVDAVVFFKPVEGTATQGATSKLAGLDAMPLGKERKQAAFDAVHQIGTATLEANRPAMQELVAKGLASSVDELWSVNAVRLRGASLETLKSLVGPGIAHVVIDEKIAVPQVTNAFDDSVNGASELPVGKFDGATGAADVKAAEDANPDEVLMDWGTARMKAPAAWAQGITGAGIVVGSLDTGVYTRHSALSRNYRGTQPDGTQVHDYNWKDMVKELPYETDADGKYTDVPTKMPDGQMWDPANGKPGETSKITLDLNGHGTHTSGSVLGWDPKHITGVAPDAKLIVARGLGEKGGSMFDLMAAMEWFMAPTKVDGTAPRPDLAPDIVTNSWGGAAMGNPFLWMALRNWNRSGIIPVFASGNNRTAKPGEVAVPGMYPEAITVGASDLDEQRAWFSMYGPSEFSNDHKPEVMAPGHWTYSTLPDGSVRDTFPIDGKEYPASGTSMATPHVAGAVALYLQAHPGAKFDDVLQALKGAATLSDHPNDEMGYGRVELDKLIAPGTISKDAKLTDPARVKELADQVAKAVIFKEGVRKPGKPTATEETPAPAKPGEGEAVAAGGAGVGGATDAVAALNAA